jgi:hypothetical protein
MNPLFAVAESGMIVRYDPSVVANPESIFEKMSRREFKTIKGFHTVNLYDEPHLSNKIRVNWNTTVTNDSICTWGYFPKLPFNTTFELMEFSGEVRLVPNFSRPDRNLNNSSIIQSNLFWDPIKAMENDPTKEIKILFANNVNRSEGSYQAVNYLIFQLFNKTNNELIGNFLPPIPNIFNDGKICMGRAFLGITEANSDTLGKLVQDSIDSFYSSSANEDLITDSMNRRDISSQLFGWNSAKETSPLMGNNIERLLKVKVGNFLLDNLPYEN